MGFRDKKNKVNIQIEHKKPEELANQLAINPFAPEPPVTARADPGPFYPLWCHQF